MRGGTNFKVISWFKARAAILVTAFVFLLGIYALYHLFAPLNRAELATQIRSVPYSTLVTAIFGTALGYFALIGYDLSALRYIGKKIPAKSVFFGSFLGYSIGNTVGLNSLTGGAIRYRIYNSYGLDAYDVAKISAFSAVSFGVGATILGLVALTFHPEGLQSISNISASTLSALSLATVVAMLLVLTVLARREKPMRILRWDFTFPSQQILWLQLVITSIEILASGYVLYALLPNSELSFLAFLVAYAIALMVGILSHVPGGVGVFETVIIAALPNHVSIEQAAAGLLLFRIIYYLMPFLISLVALAIYEVLLRLRPESMRISSLAPILNVARGFVPTALAFLVLASGVFLLTSSMLVARAEFAEDIELLLPFAFFKGPVFATSVIGSLLIILAIALWHQLWIGYILLLATLAANLFFAFYQGNEIDKGIYLILLLAISVPFQNDFFRRSRLPQLFRTKRKFWLILLTVIGFTVSIYFLILDPKDMNQNWWSTYLDGGKFDPRGLVVTLSVILVLGFSYFSMQPRHGVTEIPDKQIIDRAEAIIEQWGTSNDKLTLTGDKSLMFAENDRAVIAFAKHARSWIALGAPIGAKDAILELMWDFVDAARREGAKPVFYEADKRFMPFAVDLGFSLFKMGEEAIINLKKFSLEGPSRKKLRTTYNRALRDGMELQITEPSHSTELVARLRSISDEWLATQKGAEKQFSVGQFQTEYIARTPIACLIFEEKIVAFANLLVCENDRSISIDLMRYSENAPSSTMEFMFTALLIHFSELGYEKFSLGLAPLSGFEKRSGAGLWARFGSLVFEHGNRFYSFEGLRRFKSKFDPDWEPRYLVSKSVSLPILALKDATMLISGKT